MLKALPEVVRNCFGDYRIPAFLIDGDTLFEARKEETALVEVFKKRFRDVVLVLECWGPMIVVLEFEVSGVDLKIGRQEELVVVFAEDLLLGKLLDEERLLLHYLISMGFALLF